MSELNTTSALRPFDITCCDVDAAVLARNALLFTLLADDIPDRSGRLWDLFYHMFVDQQTLSMLFDQCRKLIALAENTKTWRAGPYGHCLTTCNAETLAQLRRVWTMYLYVASFSGRQAKQFERRFVSGMKEMSQGMRRGGTTTADRSAGPLSLYAAPALSAQFTAYWSRGVTDGCTPGQNRHLSVNPTFAFSADGDKFSVHYGTNPLAGFHLAEAFSSCKFTHPRERIPPQEMVRVAKDQFFRWCASMSKRLKGDNSSPRTFVIRMFAGDALSFCQALKYCDVMRSPVTPYNVSAWRLPTITLDDHDYGQNSPARAPLSFNVIDTSNILDHVGLVNILVVTAPLLRQTPSATLYTEGLLRTGENPSQAILDHLCGDLPTMALLLGIIPSTFISQFATRSNVHENLSMSQGTKQYHERLAWKAIGVGRPKARHNPNDVPASPQRLCFAPEDLAVFFHRVYIHMFRDEDIQSKFQLLSLSPWDMVREVQRSSVLHYNRRSFALLIHFVKTRIHTNWECAMDLFEDLVLADRRLSMGQHAYQELCCHLHLLGVHTPVWLSMDALFDFETNGPLGRGLFNDWTRARIPQVTITVMAPSPTRFMLLTDLVPSFWLLVISVKGHDGNAAR